MEETLRSRISKRVRIIVVLLLAVALSVGTVVATQMPAQAAGQGAGYGTWDNDIGWQGAFIAPDGQMAYCVEPGMANPSGHTTDGGFGAVYSRSPYGDRWVPADDLARINYVITAWGQTWNNREASAVSFAVKYWANPGALFKSHGWNGSWDLHGYINWVLNSTVGGAEARAVADRTVAIINASAGVTASSAASGSGHLTFQVDGFNNYQGTITMEGTTSTGSVTLTNGVFTSNNSATLTGMQANTPYPIRGVPPEGGGEYKISGTGTFTTGQQGWRSDVRIWLTGAQQVTAGPGLRPPASFNVSGIDPMNRSSAFQPVLSTTAVKFLEPGQRPTDELTFFTAADAEGVNNPWPTTQSGYRAVRADGVLYGPYADQPAESATVPAGAPVAARATVNTGTTGPTQTYTATGDTSITAGGYYTWVWNISYANQPATTRLYLDPGYSFTDHFGQVIETSIVPMDVRLNTTVANSNVAPGAAAVDRARLVNDGLWLSKDGLPVPVVVRWDAYVDTATPVRGPGTNIPATATKIGTYTRSTTSTFDLLSTPSQGATGAIVVPASAQGHVVWVASILKADQPSMYRPYVREFIDDYGIPAETSTIHRPMDLSISTQVTSASVLEGGTVADTATVTSARPWLEVDGAPLPVTLRWDAYLDSKEPLRVSGTNIPSTATLLGSHTQTITAPGEYTTPTSGAGAITVPEGSRGHVVWVASVRKEDQLLKYRTLINEFVDDYGVLTEITSVTPKTTFNITTQVQNNDLVAGDIAIDRATVSTAEDWPVVGGNPLSVVMRWDAYLDTASNPVRGPGTTIPATATRIGTHTQTITGPGQYTTPSSGTGAVTVPAGASGHVVWVVSVRLADQPAANRQYLREFVDDYGVPSEISRIRTPLNLAITTQVGDVNVPAGGVATDHATVTTSAPWLNVNGSPVPVVMRWDAYVDTASSITRRPGANIPSTATHIGTYTRTITAPGTYSTPAAGSNGAIAVPSNATGHVVWVASVRKADQPVAHRKYINAFTDDYGVPSEISKIHTPMQVTITTQVTEPELIPGEVSVDTARLRTSAPWIALNGTPVPVTVRWDAYVDTQEPTRGPGRIIPGTARHIGTVTQTVTSASDIRTPDTTAAGGIAVPAGAKGHVVWVASVRSADQQAAYRPYIREFVDDYGVPSEIADIHAPMKVKATTQVVQNAVALGDPIADRATVTIDGHWLNKGGKPVPAVIRWDAYFDTAEQIEQVSGKEIPSTATHLGTHTQTITGPGEYSTPESFDEGALRANTSGEGHIVWVFSVLKADQGQNADFFREFVDDYGVPSEVSRVLQPQVTTEATAGRGEGNVIFDTAYIEGTLPDNGAMLTFDLYKVPVAQDADGVWGIDYPTEDENGDPVTYDEGDLSWVCTAENLYASNDDDGELIKETGTYTSPEFAADDTGKYLWSEKLWSVPVGGEERELIHAGDCGIKEETSFAVDVKTYAKSDTGASSRIEHGIKVWDTAELRGYVPEGGKVAFEAYIVPVGAQDGDLTQACTPERLNWTSPAVDVKGGFYAPEAPLLVTGDAHVFDPDVDSQLYWVAVVYDELEREVSRGECGDPDETLGLKGQRLIQSGADLAGILIWGSGGLAILAGLIALFIFWRTRRS